MNHRNVAVIAMVVLLAGCEDGTLILSVADAPVDSASSVVLQISELEVLREDGDDRSFTFSPPREIDLLDFTGGNSTILLDRVRLPEGDYTGFRFTIDTDDADESFVDPVDGAQVRLVLEDGGNDITIDAPFTIERREELALTVDFDVRRSLLSRDSTDDPFEFDPVTRVVNDEDAATISGTVASGLIDGANCTPVVYLYEGHDLEEPGDLGSTTSPDASAPVRVANGQGTFKAAFLFAGDYTVALTCDAADDDPRDSGDRVEFLTDPAEVSVGESETESVNFVE